MRNMSYLSKAESISSPFKPREFDWKAEQLYEMRHVKGLSFGQIAMRFGCDHTTVMWAFKRLGVPMERPLRGPAEIRVVE
jgi:hypothetical protein